MKPIKQKSALEVLVNQVDAMFKLLEEQKKLKKKLERKGK